MANFDDIKDRGSLISTKGTDLLRSRQERMGNKSVQEVRVLERVAQDQAEIEKIMASQELKLSQKLEEISRFGARIEELKKAASQLEKGRMYGAEKTFKTGVQTMLGSSATSSDISGAARMSGTIGPAISMAETMSTPSIESSIARDKGLLARQTERIRETASNIEGNEGKFALQMQTRERLIGSIGQGQAALQHQRRMGVDTASQYYSAASLTDQVQEDRQRRQIAGDVASGRAGTKKQVEEQLEAVSRKLISTFEQLDEAVKTNAAESDALAKQFNGIEKEYKKTKEVLGEMNRTGMGGGGGGMAGAMSALGPILQGAGVITSAGSQIYRYGAITSEMQQTQNRIGFASLANQRFTDNYSASQGDMAALRRVMSDQYSEQVKQGLLLGSKESKAKLGETAGGGMGIAGNVLVGAGAGAAIGSVVPLVGTAAGGVVGGLVGAGKSLLQSTPEIVATAQNGIDYSKQLSQGQITLARAAQIRELADTVNQISDFSSQTAFDYQKNLTYSTRGLGVGKVPFMQYYTPQQFTGTGALGTGVSEILPSDGGTARLITEGAGGVKLGAGTDEQQLKRYIKAKEGFSGTAYGDTSKGYSIGYGSFVAGTSQRGKTITKEAANALFETDFASHKAGVDNMLGPDIMEKLNPGQRSALYDLSYNAGPGSLKYGRKGQSIYYRLKGGDIEGAGTQLLRTAITSDGAVNPQLIERRQEEWNMFAGGNVPTKLASSKTIGSVSDTMRGGGDRESIQSILTDPAAIQKLADAAGLGIKDIPKLVGMGVGGMGKEFARGGAGDITRAGELARIGYMQSPEQYFQARSQMTGVGGSGADFEEILKNAVANGMDASKNIMQMVEATTALSGRSAQMGISTFGGAAEMMGKGIDALRGTGVSENMAVGAAQKAAETVEGISSSSTLNIPNVIEMQKIRTQFPKASLQELMSMQHMSVAQVNQLREKFKSGDEAGGRELAIKLGVGGSVGSLADVERLRQDKSEKTINTVAGFGLDEGKRKSIIEKERSGAPLTPAERSFLNGVTGLGFGASGDAVAGIVSTAKDAAKGTLTTVPGGRVASGEDTIRGAAAGDSKVFAEGMNNFQKALGGYEALGQTMLKVAAAMKPEEYAKGTKEAASDFKIPTQQFGNHVATFKTAIDNFISGMSGIFGKSTGSKPDLSGQVNTRQSR